MNERPLAQRLLIFTSTMLILAAGAWYGVSASLSEMTRNDCNAGVQAACEALQ
jgi:hypothetical protein